MTIYLDGLAIGQEFACGEFTLSRTEIIDFATQFDPQPWHLDEALARESYFESLCASGLHTQAAAIGLVVRAITDVAVIAGGSLQEARFFAPVRPGQTYRVTACWTEARRSTSNPSRGVAGIAITARNDDDQIVMRCGITYIIATS